MGIKEKKKNKIKNNSPFILDQKETYSKCLMFFVFNKSFKTSCCEGIDPCSNRKKWPSIDGGKES